MKFALFLFFVAILQASPAGADDRTLELAHLKSALAPSLLEIATLEVPALRNISIETENGTQYLELEMFPDQQHTNNGNRAEVSIDFPYQNGDTVTYSWRMRIPHGSKSDAPNNRWWLLAQWHDQPNRNIGENWDNFPRRSPSISLSYGVIDNQDVLAVSYGAPEQKSITYTPLSRGVWHQVKAVIHWSTEQDGAARIFLNDTSQPFANATGQNMHNDFQHYMKLGIYRHPDINVNSQVHIDGVQIRKN